MLLFTHWPAIVEASVGSEPIHLSLHVLIVASALVMWWPVMSPLPEMPSLSAPGQMIYLFLQSLAPTIPASFLTFGHTPLYPVYATFPRIWGMSALTDQLIAGLIMKLAGGLLLWTVIAVDLLPLVRAGAARRARPVGLPEPAPRDRRGALPMSAADRTTERWSDVTR